GTAVRTGAGPPQPPSPAGVAPPRGLRAPVASTAPGSAPQLMKPPAAPAPAAMLHVVSAAPAVSAELPGVQKMVASYQKKYPDSPVDSGVLSGYNAAQLMGNNLEAACEAGGLSREDVVKAHRAQTNADTGLGTAQNFSDVDRPASVETYVLKPDAKAVGSVVNAEDAHTAPGVEDYLTSK